MIILAIFSVWAMWILALYVWIQWTMGPNGIGPLQAWMFGPYQDFVMHAPVFKDFYSCFDPFFSLGGTLSIWMRFNHLLFTSMSVLTLAVIAIHLVTWTVAWMLKATRDLI
jgi:hypothetical protein